MKYEYKIRYNDLVELYTIGKKISCIDLGHTGKTVRSFLLEDIVEKLLLHANSIIVLFKNGNSNNYKELDIGAIATLARNIIDCANNYFYFAERKIDKEELNLRFDISAYHDLNQSKIILNKLNFPTKNFSWSISETSILNTKRDIVNSTYYKNLSSEEKQKLSLGNKQKKEYNKKCILDKNMESAFYNILSSSVHSFNGGLGNNTLKDIKIMYGNFFDSLRLLCISFEIVIIYLANVLYDYLALIKRLNKLLTVDEKKKIKSLLNIDPLLELIDNFIKDYNYDPFDFNI